MALNDNAVLTPDTGHFFLAAAGSTVPVDLTAVTTPWAEVGNTSIEDIFGISSEGGESTVLATLQNKTLRTKKSARTDSFTFTLQQFDADSLKLYFGSNMAAGTGDLADWLGVPENPVVTTQAFLAVFIDGANVFAFYAPKAEVFRGDDMSFGDTEGLAGLPLTVTPVKMAGFDEPYYITPLAAA